MSLPGENTVKSTLVEPPPESSGLDEESADFIRADSVRELAEKTNIGNDEVLDRVLLPGKRFGSYHILGFVAAGGMGEIYAAKRVKSDGSKSRPVALKVITDEYANDWRIIERFKREARISKAIRSRHVARVYEFGESPQGHAFLSMELLNGEELFDRLHRNRMLSPFTVAELTLQILKGLHKIHESGFVHRDIKPENIFLAHREDASDDTVKIIDFGVAKRAEEKSDPLLSVAGQIYGTPQYIAPEQAVDPDVDHRADLYSLGVVMYECVTGNLPFDGESSYDTIVAHQNEEVPPLPSSIDPAFADIIYQAMTKDPELRFQSALEMGRVLKRWVDETSWVEETDSQGGLQLQSPGALSDSDDIADIDETEEDIPVDLVDQPHIEESDHGDDGFDSRAPTRLDDTPGDAAPPNDDLVDDAPPPAGPDSSELGTAPTTDDFNATDERLDTDGPTHQSASAESSAPKTADADSQASTPAPGEDGLDSGGGNADISPPAIDATTELRTPRTHSNSGETSESDARAAQIVTGIALGLLILAVMWTILL